MHIHSCKFRASILALVLFLLGLIPALYVSLDQPEILPQASGSNTTTHTPKRIICTSPALCEIAYALGLGTAIVGLGDECTFPAQTAEVKKIGKWGSTSSEVLVSLEPDLILTQGMDTALESYVKANAVQVLDIAIENLNDLYQATSRVAATCNIEQKGSELNTQIRRQLADIKKETANTKPLSVFLTLSRSPGSLSGILTAGKDSFLSQLLVIAGGKNVFSDAHGLWPQISRESLLVRSPEVIIELIPHACSPDDIAKLRADWREMPDLRAVKTGQIYYLCSRQAMIPGPDVTLTARELYTLLHKHKDNK